MLGGRLPPRGIAGRDPLTPLIARLVAGRAWPRPAGAGSVPALITLAVGVAVLIYALDLTVVATAAPTIVGEFHALGLYGWLFSAYAIPATATTLLYGRLADVYGRKRLFAIVMAGFLAGSVACGLAGSMLQLVVFRALQGLCAGATFPLAVGIIADVYPIEQRARGFSIVPFTFALASVLGPTAGGFITDSLGWRWIFFLNVPVVLLAVGILSVVYHEDRQAHRATLRRVDVPGALLLAAGLATLLAGISTGVNGVSGLPWQTVAALIGGLALLAAFVVRERHTASPLLPLHILRHRGLGGALLTIGLLIWITNSLLFFIPSLAQGVLGGTARSAGLILIPLMLTWSLVALVSLRAGQRFGFRTVALIGCAALAVALIALAMVGPHDTQPALILPMLLAGMGAGMINPNMMLLAQHSLSDRDQGLAGGLANCTMSLTAALVAPILGALEVSRLAAHFGRPPSEPSLLLSAAGRHQLAVQFGAAYVHGLQVALGAALHDVFAAGFLALALIVVWLLVVVPSNAVARRIRLAPLGSMEQRPSAKELSFPKIPQTIPVLFDRWLRHNGDMTDRQWEARALELARSVLGRVRPRPAVGAVLVRDGTVVGEGATQPPDGPHAEIIALWAAGERARGATLYVTLEPCCHHGRTPPCTQAIKAAGVAEVRYAIRDPNPEVAGQGDGQLHSAGIRVIPGHGWWAEEARRVNEAYLHWVQTGRPFVVAKWAMSLDGRMATPSGDSRWITGEEARHRVHQVRNVTDAILIGSGTALADDPALTTRLKTREVRHPLRIVLDARGRLPVTTRLVAGGLPGRTLVATTASSPPTWRAELEAGGVEVLVLPAGTDRGVDLVALLELLGQRDITSVLVEGGATVLGAFVEAGFVDKYLVFVAPVVIGGVAAPGPVGGSGAALLAQALRLHRDRIEDIGQDVLLTCYPRHAADLSEAPAPGMVKTEPSGQGVIPDRR